MENTYTGNSLAEYRSRKSPQINYKQIAKEYIGGIAVMGLFLLAFLGWTAALSSPVCTHDYRTNITSC